MSFLNPIFICPYCTQSTNGSHDWNCPLNSSNSSNYEKLEDEEDIYILKKMRKKKLKFIPLDDINGKTN